MDSQVETVVPDIQVCGTRGREDLVNATITSNAGEEEEEVTGMTDVESGEQPHCLPLSGRTPYH